MSATQNMDTPHERRAFKAHGHIDVITLRDFTIGRGIFEPACVVLDTGIAAYAKPA